ncbi:hypothetical protein STCU_04628 [Strigomonas culicis]|uniref:ACB domain-containing protein n=1 Tax=Strigomonas culicis TaxID=28005 RepID=S9UKJ3_9TRYP|nr:hypothetical protein STCU_04628 [Strigomonas culicis]|eukprot:EPY29294.1 hypothetical protein STCU_04628 [Strigomonas culicis]
MEYAFPEKFHKAVECFHHAYAPLETCAALTDEQKLTFYALEQQATHGPCREAAPPFWQVRERYKHGAWKSLQGMSTFEAMVHFVRAYEEVLGGPVNWPEKVAQMERERADGRAEGGADPSPPHWDADLQLYAEPTEENIQFLVEELMRVRRALEERQAQAPPAVPTSAPTSLNSVSVGCQTDDAVPPVRESAHRGAPAAPPLKPCLMSSADSKPFLGLIPPQMRARGSAGGAADCTPPGLSGMWAKWVHP